MPNPIDALTQELSDMASALGKAIADREKYRKMYEEVLGALRLASDKIGKLEEQLADLSKGLE